MSNLLCLTSVAAQSLAPQAPPDLGTLDILGCTLESDGNKFYTSCDFDQLAAISTKVDSLMERMANLEKAVKMQGAINVLPSPPPPPSMPPMPPPPPSPPTPSPPPPSPPPQFYNWVQVSQATNCAGARTSDYLYYTNAVSAPGLQAECDISLANTNREVVKWGDNTCGDSSRWYLKCVARSLAQSYPECSINPSSPLYFNSIPCAF